MSPQQVAATIVASMTAAAAQPTAESISEIFQQGVTTTMRMYTELQSNKSVYKRLTDIQKGALLDFCNETLWSDVHRIWKKIELTKNEADLRRILDKEWGKHATNLNIMYYKIYWSDELLMVIRKVAFTESGEATFLTSEMELSLLQMMPRTPEEEQRFNAER